MKRLEVHIDDKKILVKAQKVGNKLWCHFNGNTYQVAFNKEPKQKRSSEHEVLDGNLRSPLPGKIIRVNVKSGDTVKTHQTLLVMEAMKMEYNIKAPFDGVVETLNCQVGDQVALESLLIVIKKAQDKA